MKRRAFIKLCSGAAVLLGSRPTLLWAGGATQKDYQRVALIDGAGLPFKAGALAGSDGFIFHYPYLSTPVLLLDLGHKVDGGVGPGGGIVAFTAICPHQLAYPTASLSAINYHPGKSSTAGREHAITCCLHGSAFDATRDGAVIAGPAPGPLTVISLDYDAGTDGITAVGTRGAELYPQFFKAFKRELRDQYGRSAYKQEAQGQARVEMASKYSAQRVSC
jgi:Rieske Fe-S protein